MMIDECYFSEFPILESERLRFRQLTILDASNIQTIRSDERVMEFMDSDRHSTLDKSLDFIKNSNSIHENHEGLFWAIIEKKSNKFVGDFSFWKINKKNSRAEIGYSLNSNYWGKGYMSESMQTMINFGFEKLNIHSFEANINPLNENSKKLLKRIGFKKEAYFRENYCYNEKFKDSEIYSLLKSDTIN